MKQYEVAKQITERYTELFMLYEPHFLYDGYVYEVFNFGGK